MTDQETLNKEVVDIEALDVDKENQIAEKSGPLGWFTKNSVAANMIMIVLLLGGFMSMKSVKQEVFPEFDLDLVNIQITYPGASPEDVESGLLLAVEESVSTLEGIKDVLSTARESVGVTTLVLEQGVDADKMLNDVKARIDRITSFPERAERPNVFRPAARSEVISLVLHGNVREKALREMSEAIRTELSGLKDISFVELVGTRPFEISIEISQNNLRQYGLTLDRVAQAINRSSLDLPGGSVRTQAGEVLIRTKEKRESVDGYEDIVILSNQDGGQIRLGDIATTIKDNFSETDQSASFNGENAIMIRAFRSGSEKPLDIAKATRDYAEKKSDMLPPGVSLSTWIDWSVIYEQRIGLLVRNAGLGLLLVLLILGLFLDIKLAFWVTLGIPISFVGSMLFLPSADVSINMISLFAYILVLGMVVDDAIVVGESVFLRKQRGMSSLNAAISGVREVAIPVVFAIVTTILAYIPMLYVPGAMGKFFRVIPVTVITVLLLSLVESLIILPAHLAHSKKNKKGGFFSKIDSFQQKFSRGIESFIDKRYRPLLHAALRRRYLTWSIGIAFFAGSIGLCAGGRIEQVFMPEVDGEIVIADARLPYGSSLAEAERVKKEMFEKLNVLFEDAGGADKVSRGVFTQIGSHSLSEENDPTRLTGGSSGAHLVEVAVFLVDPAVQVMTSSELARKWRESLSDITGLEKLSFDFATGPGGGAPVSIELVHSDFGQLRKAASWIANELKEYKGVYDIDDGFSLGKVQLDYTLTQAGRTAGITEFDLASQVRAAFFGAEATRQQRGRDEVRTYVRLPKKERSSEYYLDELMIMAANGNEVRLADAGVVDRGRGFTEISRKNRRRTQTVTSQVDSAIANAKEINIRIGEELLTELKHKFPNIDYNVGGEQQAEQETNQSLMVGGALSVLGMFALLAIVFKSYAQPALILIAIPFGVVGALWGHFLLGYAFSMMSILGVVALSGVVINDSLILIVAVNDFRQQGMSAMEAVLAGGTRRFRPIILTSLTTFFGLVPMLLETETQAQFLVPMAISLACGVMFATLVTLLLIPAAYLVLEDVVQLFSRQNKHDEIINHE